MAWSGSVLVAYIHERSHEEPRNTRGTMLRCRISLPRSGEEDEIVAGPSKRTTVDVDLVEGFLLNARSTLHTQVGAVAEIQTRLRAFEEHMSKKAFEPALDQLAEIGGVVRPGARFWSSLYQAAGHLGLKEKEGNLMFIFAEEASRALDEKVKLAQRERRDG